VGVVVRDPGPRRRQALDDLRRRRLPEVGDVRLVGDAGDLEINVGNGRSELFDAGAYGGLLFLIYGR
jgi:hypothetical protein